MTENKKYKYVPSVLANRVFNQQQQQKKTKLLPSPKGTNSPNDECSTKVQPKTCIDVSAMTATKKVDHDDNELVILNPKDMPPNQLITTTAVSKMKFSDEEKLLGVTKLLLETLRELTDLHKVRKLSSPCLYLELEHNNLRLINNDLLANKPCLRSNPNFKEAMDDIRDGLYGTIKNGTYDISKGTQTISLEDDEIDERNILFAVEQVIRMVKHFETTTKSFIKSMKEIVEDLTIALVDIHGKAGSMLQEYRDTDTLLLRIESILNLQFGTLHDNAFLHFDSIVGRNCQFFTTTTNVFECNLLCSLLELAKVKVGKIENRLMWAADLYNNPAQRRNEYTTEYSEKISDRQGHRICFEITAKGIFLSASDKDVILGKVVAIYLFGSSDMVIKSVAFGVPKLIKRGDDDDDDDDHDDDDETSTKRIYPTNATRLITQEICPFGLSLPARKKGLHFNSPLGKIFSVVRIDFGSERIELKHDTKLKIEIRATGNYHYLDFEENYGGDNYHFETYEGCKSFKINKQHSAFYGLEIIE